MASKKSGNRKRPMVVGKYGKFRFQSGMVTANLLKRGLSMDDAFALSVELREQLHSPEVTTDELKSMLAALVKVRLGLDALPPRPTDIKNQVTLVATESGVFPFSKGILLRQLVTSGLEVEAAYLVAKDIEDQIFRWSDKAISQSEIDTVVETKLLEMGLTGATRRYRLFGWLKESTKPVIIFIGGSTGTGKSTLATELAYHLGIRIVTSTDMIRETMRTVLSAEVVPGLHDHSFRGISLGSQVLTNPKERVLAGFRQQSAQVSVGIRAAIRRAVRDNTHMIIEGTHLLPPFEDLILPGLECHFAGFVLGIPHDQLHLARFPARAKKAVLRRPEPYLDSFQSVRWIHDDLLHEAEEHGTLTFDNQNFRETIVSAVDYLSKALPVGGEEKRESLGFINTPAIQISQPTLLLILDGLPDEINHALGNKTPLEAAHTPTFDQLAGSGVQGLIQTATEEGVPPGTDQGIRALLGDHATDAKPLGRGLLEALGKGIPLPRGAVLFRGNLATKQTDGILVDRRAGRIREGTADLLSDLRNLSLGDGITGHIFPAHEHRVVVMLQGIGLSAMVCDTDPGGNSPIKEIVAAAPTDDSLTAKRTARALDRLLSIAQNHLSGHPLNSDRASRGLHSANCVITRGAASVEQLPRRLDESECVAIVSGCTTSLGIARAFGFQPVTSDKMTGNLDTDVQHKLEIATKLLDKYKLVAVHFKATDIAAHDQKPLEKRSFIEKIDRELRAVLQRKEGLRVVVSADHGTSSKTGQHMADPVPVLLGEWDPESEPANFNEESAKTGVLGMMGPGDLMELLQR